MLLRASLVPVTAAFVLLLVAVVLANEILVYVAFAMAGVSILLVAAGMFAPDFRRQPLPGSSREQTGSIAPSVPTPEAPAPVGESWGAAREPRWHYPTATPELEPVPTGSYLPHSPGGGPGTGSAPSTQDFTSPVDAAWGVEVGPLEPAAATVVDPVSTDDTTHAVGEFPAEDSYEDSAEDSDYVPAADVDLAPGDPAPGDSAPGTDPTDTGDYAADLSGAEDTSASSAQPEPDLAEGGAEDGVEDDSAPGDTTQPSSIPPESSPGAIAGRSAWDATVFAAATADHTLLDREPPAGPDTFPPADAGETTTFDVALAEDTPPSVSGGTTAVESEDTTTNTESVDAEDVGDPDMSASRATS